MNLESCSQRSEEHAPVEKTTRTYPNQLMLWSGDVLDFNDPRVAQAWDLFVELAERARARGLRQYSARAIFHLMRWHYHVERGDRAFKIPNQWSPHFSRRLMSTRPDEFGGFFQTRGDES